MNFFKRRQRDPAVAETSTTNHREKRAPVAAMNMNRRPTFGQWLKVTWLDLFTMAAMGMIGLGVCIPLYTPKASDFGTFDKRNAMLT